MGVKQGRAKGNKQKAKYSESDRMHGKPGRMDEGEWWSESKTKKLWKQAVRQKQWKRGKEETEAE